jgi:hypothetical protein
LRKFQEEGSSVVDVVLTHQKINAGNMNAPIAVRFHFPYDGDETGLVSIQGLNMTELPQETLKDGGVSLKDRIKFAVKSRAMSLEQIAENLGYSSNLQILANALRSMEQKVLNRMVRTVDNQEVEYWGLKLPSMAE